MCVILLVVCLRCGWISVCTAVVRNEAGRWEWFEREWVHCVSEYAVRSVGLWMMPLSPGACRGDRGVYGQTETEVHKGRK